MLEKLNAVLEHWEPLWLFLILHVEALLAYLMLKWMKLEYFYDKNKDEKRTRRKTTKRITKSADGSVTEEQSEEVTSPDGGNNGQAKI